MGSLLHKPGEVVPEGPGPKALFIRGQCYANTAAKFWAGLIDEVVEDYPGCTRIELAATTAAPFDRDLLRPEKSLEKDLESLWEADFEQVFRDTLAELELIGLPAAVRLRLLREAEEVLSRDLPMDAVDAEVFPHLAVWPLEWARIPEALWNADTVDGAFEAEDRIRGIRYAVSFTLTRRHLREGLYERSFRLAPAAGPL